MILGQPWKELTPLIVSIVCLLMLCAKLSPSPSKGGKLEVGLTPLLLKEKSRSLVLFLPLPRRKRMSLFIQSYKQVGVNLVLNQPQVSKNLNKTTGIESNTNVPINLSGMMKYRPTTKFVSRALCIIVIFYLIVKFKEGRKENS